MVYNDKILAKDLISINRVSLLLTGNEFTLRWDRGFGKYKSSVDRLLIEVQDWIDSDKSTDLSSQKEIVDDKEYRGKIKDLTTEYISIDEDADLKSFATVVSMLPKERKMISDPILKGLYTAGNKWYTNKIVDNVLVILEWDKLDYAKKYLESLIK